MQLSLVDSVSARFKNARVKKMPLNIRMHWNAGTACMSECVLKRSRVGVCVSALLRAAVFLRSIARTPFRAIPWRSPKSISLKNTQRSIYKAKSLACSLANGGQKGLSPGFRATRLTFVQEKRGPSLGDFCLFSCV